MKEIEFRAYFNAYCILKPKVISQGNYWEKSWQMGVVQTLHTKKQTVRVSGKRELHLYSGIRIENDSFDIKIGEDCVLMQYTGLKDKNGVKIFEGDIVKTDDKLIFEVKWDDEWCGFNLIVDARPIEVFPYDSEMIEVIGNIHQNKELLS